jgi:predicted transcriptional regulator
MEKTTLYLPTELQAGIRDLARRTGRPQAAIIREALERFVGDQERPLPRSIGAGMGGRVNAADSEAWLRSEWDRQAARRARRKTPGGAGSAKR